MHRRTLGLCTAILLITHTPTHAQGLTTIDGCANLRLRVASEAAHKFQAFFCALKREGHHIIKAGTACQAYGHMKGSKHDWGGACDIMQRARSKTVRFMYHVTKLAKSLDLVDGCTWHHRDCGHIEVPGSNRIARARHYGYTTVVSAHRHLRQHQHQPPVVDVAAIPPYPYPSQSRAR